MTERRTNDDEKRDAPTPGDWSVPETAVMDALDGAIDDGRPAALATVVAIEGSAYRRPGAKMLVAEGGDGVGSITAGCLENEVVRLAEAVRADGEPRVKRFDLTGDEQWGMGVGCNGVIDILLEPLDGSYRQVVDAYRSGEDIAVLTVVDGDGDLACGDRAFAFPAATPDAEPSFDAAGWPDPVVTALAAPVDRLLTSDTSDTVRLDYDGHSVDVFVDSVTAPPELVVFGSGHDVAPVVERAKGVDFRVTVATFRGAAAEPDRFPAADRVLSTAPADLREALTFDGDTYAVLMTHNFVDDRLALDELLATPVEYVGLMGPRKRFAEMREAFAAEGRTFDDGELARIYTPAGLDLGGGTPHHIAQSIVAEVTAVHHDRDPKHLTAREGPIHDRVETTTD